MKLKKSYLLKLIILHKWEYFHFKGTFTCIILFLQFTKVGGGGLLSLAHFIDDKTEASPFNWIEMVFLEGKMEMILTLAHAE